MKKLIGLVALGSILALIMFGGVIPISYWTIPFSLLLIVLSILTLILGGDSLVEGSYAIANKFNIHPIIIGMTILAIGTSMPELFVNMIAAFRGETGLLIANIVGSNISNLLLIGGITAILAPIAINPSTLFKEVPISLGAALLLLILINDQRFGSNSQILSSNEGIILLVCFGLFLFQLLKMVKKHEVELDIEPPKYSMQVAVAYIALGVGGLYIGGEALVTNAVRLATMFNVSTVLIGASIVAVGTSIPELATSVIAATKKHTDMALGNIIGSNIFNILWVGGVTAIIYPIGIEGNISIDILVLSLATILLFVLVYFRKDRTVGKGIGTLFLCLYLLYIIFLMYRG